MEWLADPQAWVALATLTVLEIVLGVDNIIFISILVGRLPKEVRNRARTIGLALAMGSRIVLLFSLSWILRLTNDWFTVLEHGISGRDLILLGGGLFLIGKSTHEIHHSLEGKDNSSAPTKTASFGSIMVQIAIIDIVFSLDSVITAVGLADQIGVMVTAVLISVGVMMLSARAIGEFVDEHPTFKILALSFLILVGVALIGEGFDLHIPKGYIYFSMAFSIGVELLNMRMRSKRGKPVVLKKALTEEEGVTE